MVVREVKPHFGDWSRSTPARGQIRADLYDAERERQQLDPDTRAALLVAPDVAKAMGLCGEVHDWLMDTPYKTVRFDEALLECQRERILHGLPDTLYGFPVYVNHAQPAGTADLVGPNAIVSIGGIL